MMERHWQPQLSIVLILAVFACTETTPDVEPAAGRDTTVVFDDPTHQLTAEDRVGWTETQLLVLEDLIVEYDSVYSGAPDSVSDLIPRFLEAGAEATMYLIDSWGVPVAYSRTSQGFVLASAGPDRRFGTADDLRRVHVGS